MHSSKLCDYHGSAPLHPTHLRFIPVYFQNKSRNSLGIACQSDFQFLDSTEKKRENAQVAPTYARNLRDTLILY